MAPVNLKPTQKASTVLIVIAAAMFVCCLACCLGAIQKVRAVDSERAAVEKQVRENQIIAQTQRDAENKYSDTKAQIRCLESSVSTQAYVPTLLKQIESLGKTVHLKIVGVRPKAPDPNAGLAKKIAAESAAKEGGAASDATAAVAAKPEAPKPYDEQEIDLELEGNYMDALDFLYRLTSFPKIIAVNNIQMAPNSSDKIIGASKLDIRINATAFVFKETSPTKKTAKPAANTASVVGGTKNEAG